MNPLIEKVLQPVAASDPCGPDLYDDPRFEELETILKGKPEVEMGSIVKPAEPPDWVELRSRCVEFLRASKHLRAGVMMVCSMVKLEGLAGFRDGIQFIQSVLEQYWKDVHPRLDPEDNNDPQERLNILGVLTAPPGTTTGWLRIVEYLQGAPLCHPKGVPPITLDLVRAAANPAAVAPDDPVAKGPTATAIAMQFRNAPQDEITNNHAALQQSLEALGKIDNFLIATLGTGGAINFEELQKVLEELSKTLGQYLPSGSGEEAAEGSEQAGGEAGAGAISVTGVIRSRTDVVRMIEHLCEYYRQIEPGSPVPYLLRRAQKLATMDFVQAMQELNLATAEQLKPSLGSGVEDAAPAPMEAASS